MYVVTVDFVIKPEHALAFHTEILQQAKDSLEEPGCHYFDVCVDPADPAHIFLYELYDDLAAFEVHREYAHTKRLFAKVDSWIASRSLRCFEHLKG